ncbi:MAG: ABC transporter ATP-binding protein [Planctomycetales bacterium]
MISLENVTKNYTDRGSNVAALDNVSLEFEPGRLVCVYGPSGSGKTTLLMSIAGMLRPTAGKIIVDGTDMYGISGSDRARFRSQNIGFIFQMFHLVPYLNVLDNILLCTHGNSGATKQDVTRHIERLGLTHRAGHKPSQLSTGERQRTAIARATLLRPSVLLADEPTGNLDEENASEVHKILSDYRDQGGTVLVITHGKEAMQYADRVIQMREGRITEQNTESTES